MLRACLGRSSVVECGPLACLTRIVIILKVCCRAPRRRSFSQSWDACSESLPCFGIISDFSKTAAWSFAGNAPGSVEDWDKWAEACRIGVRQPLGVDYQGRAYWALGSRAGAWRIYVEECAEDPASSLWGFYEGACKYCS